MWSWTKKPTQDSKNMDTHSLSLMLSKVHWLFWKKACCLMSSTPLRPKRTFLSTSEKMKTCQRSLLSSDAIITPLSHNSAHRHHQHVISNTHGRAGTATGLTRPTSTESRGSHRGTVEPGKKVPGGQREPRQAGSGCRWRRQQLQHDWPTCYFFPLS